MYYKTASIILNSEQKSNSMSDIFIAQPDVHKENLAGKLFVLAEIESSKPEALKIVNFLVNNISYNYYQNEKILLRERVDNIRTESIFQDSLARTNRDLVEFLNREKIKLSPYAFNITAAVIQEDEIHFSVVGKNKNFIIYKEKTGTIKKKDKNFEPEKIEYKITSVGDENNKSSKTVNINKLFSDITSGRIPSGGYFLTVNEALSEYISTKQLLNVVTKLSPTGAAEQIKNILSQVNAYISFLGIIIKNSTSGEITGEDIKKEMEEKSQKYLNQINAVEQKTEEIMAPSGIVNLKKISKSLERKNEEKKVAKANILKKNFQLFREHVSFKKREGLLRNILLKTFGGIRFFFHFSISTLKNLSNKDKLSKAGKRTHKYIIDIKNLILKDEIEGGLKTKNKIILSISIILLTVFIINLSIADKKNKEVAVEKEFEETITQIDKIQNKIDANLLYNNESKAKELLEENRKLIESLPEDKAAEREDIKNLIKRESEQINKIRKVINVATSKKIADFAVLNSKANAQNLIISNDIIFLGDSGEKSIYKIDLKEDVNTANNDLPGDISFLDYPTATEKEINYLNGESILTLNRENRKETAKNNPIKLPKSDNVISMASFNNNLYLLGRKQIYRYVKTSSGFGNASEWLKDKEDLSKVVDIAIDGYIYILQLDGTIKKLLKGESESYKNEILYQPIENANKIITSSEHDYIYVFEPLKNRLVVFNKDKGEFINQYIFDMDNIEDVDVSEKSLKIYILKNNSVYQVELSHIKD